MATELSFAALLYKATKAEIYAKGLQIAEAIGLPVSSWAPGDPTRSDYHFLATILESLEDVVAEYIAAGFLDFAGGIDNAWLKLKAKQDFNVDAIEAQFAATSCRLTNGGGGLYEIEAGDLTLKNTATKATYTNTSGGTLSPGPGTTLDVDVVADVAGSAGSAAAGEIDDLVSGPLNVTVTNPAATIGVDAESADELRDRCRLKLGSLSPNGPGDAYEFVARTPELSGTSAVTRARATSDTDTGTVTVYLAGPSGAVSAADVALVEAAIVKWATPLTVTPSVQSAANLLIPVTYQLWLYASVGESVADIEAAVEAALVAMFLRRPIGGDVVAPDPGRLYHSLIEATIRQAYPNQSFRVDVTAPAGDTDLTGSEVAVLGTVTPTVTLVEDP